MARNGTGGYSLPVNTWNPAVNGVAATATDYQALINDIAAAIQASIAADGQTAMTGALKMGGFKATGMAAATISGDALRFENIALLESEMQNQTPTAFTTAGTATAYTIAPSPAITAYTANQSFFINFNAISGAAPTLIISGVAIPPNLVKQGADGTYSNIAAGDITLNHRSRVTLISATQALVEKLPQGVVAAPSFSAYCATNPAIASATFTKVPFDTKEYDLTNAYNIALYRGLPGVAGLYHITGFVRIGGVGNSDAIVTIYKNGVEFKRCNEFAASADARTQNMPFSQYAQLTATDFIEIYVFVSGTSSLAITGGPGNSSFQMTFIR